MVNVAFHKWRLILDFEMNKPPSANISFLPSKRAVCAFCKQTSGGSMVNYLTLKRAKLFSELHKIEIKQTIGRVEGLNAIGNYRNNSMQKLHQMMQRPCIEYSRCCVQQYEISFYTPINLYDTRSVILNKVDIQYLFLANKVGECRRWKILEREREEKDDFDELAKIALTKKKRVKKKKKKKKKRHSPTALTLI
ncbi:hypothetical protein T01_12122 [Trichinella spiralis]|uniref:Uncharacterized protein n=1 Tax=Trichinella spiralis TaxID=6334 RepID=A0A0V1BDN6_TRISP|nr:hypothetical protein T01_12122 [Trichinella spiralis]